MFSSEIMACLHPRHSIKEALATFGVKTTTTRILIVLLQTPDSSVPDFDEVNSLIPGKMADPCTLYKFFDREKVSHIYGVPNTCLGGKQAYILSVLTRMSVGLITR